MNRLFCRISTFFSKLTSRPRKLVKILVLGLDAAGKTTVLRTLTGSPEANSNIPTIGYNVVTFEYKKAQFRLWDVGGQDAIRGNWCRYFRDVEGLIFVVDSNDRERLPTAREELHKIMSSPSLSQATLLILANKQDMEVCMSTITIARELELLQLNRKFFIQKVCATEGFGLYEGIEWLYREVMKQT